MLLKHSRCGLSVFLFPMIILILYLGFHKSRAALSKVIKVIRKLIYKHGYFSFVNLMLHIIRLICIFVNRLLKKIRFCRKYFDGLTVIFHQPVFFIRLKFR